MFAEFSLNAAAADDDDDDDDAGWLLTDRHVC